MTKIDVREYPAGPEMDAAVAEVLGRKNIHKGDGKSPFGTVGYVKPEEPDQYYCQDDPQDDLNYVTHVPAYSTSLSTAWSLVERLCENLERGKAVSLLFGKSGASWTASVFRDHDTIQLTARTAPLAICRAFLLANGVMEVKTNDET